MVHSCTRSDCAEGNCHLDLTGLAAEVYVIDMNRVKRAIRHKGRICDCGVLWWRSGLIAAIELKGGRNTIIERLVEQIQGGLDALAVVVEGQPVTSFFPILMFTGKRDPTRSLAGHRAEFRGQKRRIIARRCGTMLSAIVSKGAGAPRPRRPRRSRRGSRR